MTVIHGDCIEVMAAMDPESIDAIVTDPPYGLEFMGKEWDRPWAVGASQSVGYAGRDDLRLPAHRDSRNANCRTCGGRMRGAKKCVCAEPNWDRHPRQDMLDYGIWSQAWAEAAYRVAKPSAYLLAFGGTRTVHRMTVALEDAGWIIRDMLVWGYASGFPKSKASLKPAWEPIVMARKPGPLRDLAIDACRLPVSQSEPNVRTTPTRTICSICGEGCGSPQRHVPHHKRVVSEVGFGPTGHVGQLQQGRWPANIVLTDPIFDGGIEGVVGGGETVLGGQVAGHYDSRSGFGGGHLNAAYHDSGTYSRFFLIPKADRADREPVLGGHGLEWRMPDNAIDRAEQREQGKGRGSLSGPRYNAHPTVKPTDLMRHLVRLVTPTGGTVLDPFLGSGTTGLAAEMEGFPWIGIEREAEYVAIAEARLNGTQRGLGLDVA